MRLPIAHGWQPAAAGVLFVAFTLSALQPSAADVRRADTMRPEILGTRGIVAGGRHYSVAAGVRM
jgi:hypothetical protein